MIAVISDSHVPRRADEVPREFREEMEEADLGVHCGDFVSPGVKERLEKLGELVAVKGNCDRFDLPISETFEQGGVKFGVYHGTGIQPRGHLPTLVETARKLDADVLLTGHTHQQRATGKDGKVILNPGSCTGVSGGSYQGGNPEMMKIHAGEPVEVELVELLDRGKVSETVEFEVET